MGHIPMEMVSQLEEAFDVELQDGHNSALRPMMHLW